MPSKNIITPIQLLPLPNDISFNKNILTNNISINDNNYGIYHKGTYTASASSFYTSKTSTTHSTEAFNAFNSLKLGQKWQCSKTGANGYTQDPYMYELGNYDGPSVYQGGKPTPTRADKN